MRMPPKIERQRERQLDPADDLRAGHAHAAGGVDGVAVDLADADVGVGEDRRDREQHERERDVGEADAEEGDEERDQRERSARRGRRSTTEIARNSPRPMWPSQQRRAAPRAAIASAIATPASARGASTAAARISRAADLRAAAARLARVEDEVDRVAELRRGRAQRASRRRRRPRPRACSSALDGQQDRRRARPPAARTAPPATTTLDLNVDVARRSARRARRRPRRTRAWPGRPSSSTAIRSPAMISGSASGSSTRQQQLAVGEAHARGRRRASRPARSSQPGDDVAEDDQQRVGDERDQRGRRRRGR